MSTFPAPTSLARPVSITVATALLALDGLCNLASIGGYLSGAPIPVAVVAIQVVLGVAAMVAAVRLWGQRRGAAALATVVAALILPVSGMQMLGATSATGKGVGALGLILSIAVIAVIALVALPGARRTHG